jgi:hypothetical protein
MPFFFLGEFKLLSMKRALLWIAAGCSASRWAVLLTAARLRAAGIR